MLTPSQQEFYNHLKECHPFFFDRNVKGPYPKLNHIKTPAERYRNMCEQNKC